MYEMGEKLIQIIVGEEPIFYIDTLSLLCLPPMWVYKELGQEDKALDDLESGGFL
ncbi:MAG: hypothetical protein IJ746_04645 [Ruminococcus sp.]|nr:hypothetical protein [Ruminococcus sp.]